MLFVVEVEKFGAGRQSKACVNDGILVKAFFAIKALECCKPWGIYFHSSQSNWEICGNDFYVS